MCKDEFKACIACFIAGIAFGLIYVLYVIQSDVIYYGY